LSSRSASIGFAVLGLGFVLFAAVAERLEPNGSAACPGCNVVLISVDTLRADHVGAYGYGRPTTPNLDAFAQRSILFEDAIGQSAWTRPSHFSMFTGLYPVEHGVVSMRGRARIAESIPVLAEILADNGYATGAFTGGANLSAHFGFDRGFEIYETHGKRMFDNLDAATSWLDAHATEPFFLFFHGFDPHRPYVSEPEDRRALGLPPKSARGWKMRCKRQERPADLGPLLGNYDAAIHRGDRALGALFRHLDELGLMKNTIVIVTSDHGEAFFEHGRCFHIYTLYREIVRVPLIVHVPGLEPRRVSGVVPASASVTPTILDALGIDVSDVGGPSLARVLAGRKPAFEYVVSETSSHWRPGGNLGHVRALTTDTEKLVHWVDQGRYEYYDLVADPHERRPITDHDRWRHLARALDDWLEDHLPRIGRRSEVPLPKKLERELRRLGYFD
jgi:arylsulfatase A-like enzyme